MNGPGATLRATPSSNYRKHDIGNCAALDENKRRAVFAKLRELIINSRNLK
jgi:hypothetical protein